MKWGYTINKPRVIAYDNNDLSLANEIMEAVPTLRSCIGCGNCTAACTAGGLTDFNIRALQTQLRRGEYHEAVRDIEKCMLCGKCRMVCPRGIDTRKMIVNVKRILSV